MDFEIDRTKKIRHPYFKASEIVQAAVAELDLVDVWRTIHPTRAGYTWRQKTPFLAERLDYIFIANSMLQFVEAIENFPSIFSDHSMIIVNLHYQVNPRGPGYWKFNNSLLNNRDYVEAMNKLIAKELDQESLYTSKRDHWEIIKLAIRTSTIQFTKSR